jgi:Zn-dependent protease/predicted transcriptional regulator
MTGSLRVGRIFGIPIEVHYTWLIVFGLITTTLAKGYLARYTLYTSNTIIWIIGGIASIVFFSCVVLHELMHSYIAIKRGLVIKRITLFLFGGIAEIEGEPKTAKDELYIAIAGPITSTILGFLFFVIYRLLPNIFPPIEEALGYLYRVNLILAGFNIIPAFPLDGGRVLRALLWMGFKDLRRSTRITSGIGVGFAMSLMLIGFYLLMFGQFINGLWLIFIGWFLSQGAASGEREITIRDAFVGTKVRDLMTKEVEIVPPNISIEELVSKYFLVYRYVTFPVVWGNQTLGIITLNSVKSIPREEWKNHTVREVMIPISSELTINPEESALEAFTKISKGNIGRLLVMEEDKLVGILSKTDLIRFLQIKTMMERN